MSVEGLQNLRFELGNLFNKVIPEQQHLVVKKIALEGFAKIVAKTPVDTGRARANWSVTINAPTSTTTEGIDQQPLGAPPSGLAMAVAAGRADASKSGDTIYVTNALPYILPLEEGHSKQGSHMVAITVIELKAGYGI